jgi:hypothetical protein
MTRRIRSILCGVLLAAQTLTGCASWQVVQVSPRALVDSAHVRTIQVTTKNGEQYVVHTPRVTADLLTGEIERTVAVSPYRPFDPGGLPLAAIQHLAVRQPNVGKTLLLVLGVPAAVVGALVGMIALSWDPH